MNDLIICCPLSLIKNIENVLFASGFKFQYQNGFKINGNYEHIFKYSMRLHCAAVPSGAIR